MGKYWFPAITVIFILDIDIVGASLLENESDTD